MFYPKNKASGMCYGNCSWGIYIMVVVCLPRPMEGMG